MTSAYVLIFAILFLGGLLATLGDRLGSKVGKARLRLFNLRPRQTAVVMTVVTGVFISASTLGILFALSESLRQGVFDLDEIQKKRRQVEAELKSVTNQKKQVEKELLKASERQKEVNQLLLEVNGKFETAQQELNQVSDQAKKLDSEVKKLVTERTQLQATRNQLKTQIQQLENQSAQLKTRIAELQQQVVNQNRELLSKEETISEKDKLIAQREQSIFEKEQVINQQERNINEKEILLTQKQSEIQKKQAEIQNKQKEIDLITKNLKLKEKELLELEKTAINLEAEIKNRDQLISELDTQITSKDQELQAKEASLQTLQNQLEFLKKEVSILEQYYQNYQVLRQGNLAMVRGQVLAFAAFRIIDPNMANQAVDQLLSQANRNAIKLSQPLAAENTEQRVVQITNSQVQQLIEQIKDGQEYIVRILSAGNYVQGENIIRVFADVAPNKLVYKKDEIIATVSLDTYKINPEELDQKLDLLLAATRFRARSSGILGDIQVEDGNLIILLNFLETLKKSGQPINEIKAITYENTYSVGPLKVRLLALYNGNIVYTTSSDN